MLPWIIQIGTAVIADFLDVIPNVACAEVHPATIGCVLVLAHRRFEHVQEVGQADPSAIFACAFAHRARGVADVGLACGAERFANGQVGFTLAV